MFNEPMISGLDDSPSDVSQSMTLFIVFFIVFMRLLGLAAIVLLFLSIANYNQSDFPLMADQIYTIAQYGRRRSEDIKLAMVQVSESFSKPTPTALSSPTVTSLPSDTPLPSGTPSPLPSSTTTATLTQTVTPTEIPLITSPLHGIELFDLPFILSQPYNVPNPYKDMGHHGVDFGSYNFRGQNLFGWQLDAVFSGRVACVVGDRPPIGHSVILETPYEDLPGFIKELLDIQPGQSLYHLYAHLLDKPEWNIGDRFFIGQRLGSLGDSQTVEAHLHFETRIGPSNVTLPGMAFYDTGANEEEMATYLRWRTSGEFMPFDPMIMLSSEE